MRVALLTIGCAIGVLVLGVMLFPEGEIATLSTFGADGTEHETQVWVVEGDGLPSAAGEVYLRTGEQTRWLARLRAEPAVVLQRGEERRAYLATSDDSPEMREKVNRAIAEKYGVANLLVERVYDPAKAIAVRLVPDPTRRQPGKHGGAPH